MTAHPDRHPEDAPEIDLTPAVEEGHAAVDGAAVDDAPPLEPTQTEGAGPLAGDPDEPPSPIGGVFRSGS